ncbi:hypothetical protein LINPERHAP2_LOCUS21110, partial [Linum perenne]
LHYSNPKPITKVKYKTKVHFQFQAQTIRYKISQPEIVKKIKTWSTPGPSLQESPPRQQHTDTRHTRKLLNFNSLTLTTRT